MIQIQGTLNIKTIGSRNGDFNVGSLSSELGEFSVKSSELDQYDEGSYEGTFGIAHIGLGHWSWGDGRQVTELKAMLSFIAINGVDELPEDYASIGEAEPEEEIPTIAPEVEATKETDSDEADIPATEDDLFSSVLLQAIEDGCPIQLDPTVGRPKFPNQIVFLKERGYRYDGNTKIWNKIEDDEGES